MKRLSFTIFALIFATTISLFCQPRTGRFTMGYTENGTQHTFSCYVPENYDSTKAYTFFYAWHGAGDTGWNMLNFVCYIIAVRIGAIVSSPDANTIQTNEQLNTLISNSFGFIRSNYHIDTTKEIITGFSWGGRMAYQLGLSNPGVFDGIIGIAPAIGQGQVDQTMWNNIQKIRMATLLGDQDFNFAAVNALMLDIKNRGGNLLYKIKPGVQHVDNTYFNSQEFLNDYNECYEYVLGLTDIESQENTNELLISINPNPASENTTI